MKIPVKWLAEYVDLKGISDAQLSDALTMSGTENEILKGVEFPNIVVGEIKEITAHPNADKIRVTKTDVGKENGGVLQIVCGAPNIEVGQKVPVALVGAVIGEFEIKAAEIRGVKSFGMICSEEELGISEDHTGIMVLDPRANVGAPLADVLNIGGTVLEAEITPNRSDCFSMVGIAGEAAAALERKTKNLKVEPQKISSKKKVAVEIAEPKLCGRYIAKVVEGVKIGPSPKWMADRLSAAGVRPISNIVDVTNYVMLEWGQPMHAFDAAKISGKIIVRKAKAGEKLVTLDGSERKLTAADLVIADSKKAIALAGVMGGLDTEVTEKTKDVVLEAAVFNRTSVRKTAQRLALRSEASNRFEKGIPLTLPGLAVNRAAQLLAEIAGGKVGENTDVQTAPIYPNYVGMRLSRLNKLLGVEIPEEKVMSILESLGFVAEKFDFRVEARTHVGKPYVYGAKYSTHADMAFDCSYLTDFIYRKIGQFIGHTALAQFELGKPVEFADLAPGDILFYESKKTGKEVVDSYYIKDAEGNHKKVKVSPPKLVGHCGIYIGGGRVVQARQYEYDEARRTWRKLVNARVSETDIQLFTENPGYLGARRFVSDASDWLSISVPWWRLDISIEEDIFEEIGRIYGYDNIPAELPGGKLPQQSENKKLIFTTKIKETLAGAGFSEVYNYSFVPENWLSRFGADTKNILRVANPISPEQEYMRTALGPSLLEDVRINQDNFDDIAVFEIASTYLSKGELAKENQVLGIVTRAKGKNPEKAFFEIKGALELLAKKLNLGKIEASAAEKPFGARGQTASVSIANAEIGYIAVTNDKITHEFDLRSSVAIAEIDLSRLIKFFGKTVEYQSISRFPTVKRDLNLIIEKSIPAQKIEAGIGRIKEENLQSIEISDIFEREDLPQNSKSVTIRMVFGSTEKTLTEAEILELQNKIEGQLKKTLNAVKRM